MQRMGGERCLVVTDRNLSHYAERIDRSASARAITCHVFDGGQPEPSIAVVERVMQEVRGSRVDAVIGLGGGSNIDVAKASALLLRHPGSIADYEGQGKVPGPVAPLIAVPTTAGSGSEVSAACILSVPEDDSKLGVVDNHLRPLVAIVDPELHLSCPASVTRDAGVDAFCHAVEAFTIIDWEAFPQDPTVASPVYQGKHPLSDALAERAIALIAEQLPRVLRNPDDLAARTQMANGALLAGMAMSNTGIYTVHALTYPVGALTRASHGACNGALLPAVLDFVAPARETEVGRILDLMRSDRENVADAVRDFLREIGAPASLKELGLAPGQIEPTAEIGYGIRRLMNGSPRPTSREELREIVQRAYGE